MKSEKIKVWQLLGILVILFSQIFLFEALERFYIGYHNEDLAINMINLGYENYSDIGSDFKARTPMELSILGGNQQKESLRFFISYLGLFSLGIILIFQ